LESDWYWSHMMRGVLAALLLAVMALPAHAQALASARSSFLWITPMLNDAFGRTNGSLISPWAVVTGLPANLAISSTTVITSHLTADTAYYNSGATWPGDHYSCATVVNASSDAPNHGYGVSVRVSSSAESFDRAVFGAAGWQTQEVVAGAATDLNSSTTVQWVAGDQGCLFAVGSTLTLYKISGGLWTQVDVESSTLTGGSPGLAYSSTNVAGGAINNWYAGVVNTRGPLGGAGGTAIKWHPGHYTQSDFYMTTSPSSDGTFDDIDRMAAVVDGSGNPRFKGYMIQFHWSDIEPTTQGSYSAAMVTAINAVRTRLQTNYTYNGVVNPFRLMIRLRVEAGNHLPAYITSGISGLGSDAVACTGSGPGSMAPAFWRAPVMSAYINMLNYLGSLYDSDLHVEAIAALEEASIAYTSPPGDYSGAAFYAQFQNMVNGLSSWPTTLKTPNLNFGPTGTNQAWVNTATEFLAPKLGWGIGGPDVLTATGGYGETWGELAFYGGSGSDSINRQGHTSEIIGIEDDVYLWTAQTSAGDESYGYSTLHPTHMVWMIFPESEYSGVAGNSSQWWETGTVPALQAVNFRLAASALPCPSAYNSVGCNTMGFGWSWIVMLPMLARRRRGLYEAANDDDFEQRVRA
jgi:hypothetical protein